MREIGLPEIIAICGVMVLCGLAVVLLVGALRWKQSRVVQRTLIDKLSAGNELVAFLQTSAGERFIRGITEPESPARSMIKSIQGGIVVLVVGLGTLMLGSKLGFLLISLGVGLLVAALVSYRLARKLNLLGKDADPRAY